MLCLFVKLTILTLVVGSDELNVQWTGGNNFEWPSVLTRNHYKNTGRFVAKNVVATRAVIYKDNVFVTLPRYKTGVPATLAKINLAKPKLGPHQESSMSPFPSWSIQEQGSCSSLQSAVDLFLDPQSILWVLDSGVVDVLERPVNSCPPKIVAMNARTGKVLKTIDMSPLTSPSSRLQFLVADYSPDGRVFVYVSDASNRAILVFDASTNQGYRLILPKAVSEGCDMLDVLYLNLIPRNTGGGSLLLVSYLGAKNVYCMKTAHLQNGTAHGQLRDLGPKSEKIVFLGTDNAGALYYRKLTEADVYRWAVLDDTDAGVQLVYRGSPFALPSQVVQDFKRGCVRVLETNFPDFLGATVGPGVHHSLNVI